MTNATAPVLTRQGQHGHLEVGERGVLTPTAFLYCPPDDKALMSTEMRGILATSNWFAVSQADIKAGGGQATVLTPIATPPPAVLKLQESNPNLRIFSAPAAA